MDTIKNLRISAGLLFLVGTPPYIIYDFNQIVQGEESAFHWISLVLVSLLFLAVALWLFRLKGEEYSRVKPLWERLASLVLLLLSAPLIFIVGMLIKYESRGPVLYRQRRVGKNRRKDKERRRAPTDLGYCPTRDCRTYDRRRQNLGGQQFTIYKLRSMRADAEQRTGPAWSSGDHDPRITRIGYYIRKSHIDELPQFLNVLMGHMSIIGPRPERPAFIQELSRVVDGYQDRLKVTPGITGLAQVRQQGDASVEDVRKKVEYDSEYIETISLRSDILILFQTAGLILNLFWKALKRRTVEKIEPKTIDTLMPEKVTSSHVQRQS